MNVVLSGWILLKINIYNFSLLCVWVIFFCDMVYILDVLVRISKILLIFGSWVLVMLNGLLRIILVNLLVVVKVVIFVLYYILVILELDVCGVYFVVCVFRVVRFLLLGRLYFFFVWMFLNVVEYRVVMI